LLLSLLQKLTAQSQSNNNRNQLCQHFQRGVNEIQTTTTKAKQSTDLKIKNCECKKKIEQKKKKN